MANIKCFDDDAADPPPYGAAGEEIPDQSCAPTATPRVPAKARDEILAGPARSASFIISAGTPVIATALFARGQG
jgi:hypothetical protein